MMKQKKAHSAIETMEKDDIVQAVVIADNFNNNFLPVISKSPLALLPLVCVPLINYTLESLAQSGVHETFLFCCSHVDLIKLHIQQCIKEKVAWSVTMVVHIVVSESCRSLGDALRDLDAKGLIRGYFILTGTDTVSNVQLLPLLEKYKEISKKDKGAVMSLVYKAAVPGHRAQCSGETVLLAANTDTNQVLFHQKLTSGDKQRKASFPLEIFLEHSEVTIHSDLIDTHIAICSPAVLPLFSDNFDFQTRDDFVKGILMNEEILASTIYWHQLKGDQYAARATNWQMYQTISQDVIHRWAYPLVPDMGISKQYQTYILLRNHVYRSRDVTLAKGCELEEDVVIAKGCSVEEGTIVVRSVIGEKCKIGRNCRIEDSIIMNGGIISDGCSIITSVLGADCLVNENAKILGSILGPAVHIDKNLEIKAQMIQHTSSGDSSQKLGEYAYTLIENSDNESVDSDVSEDIAKVDGLAGLVSKWWEDESVGYSSSSDDGSSQAMSQVLDDTNLFLQEVIDSLARGYEERLNCDYLILEINSSRYAYNMSLQEVNFYVIRALFSLPPMQVPTNVLATFKDLLNFFKPIVVNYIKGLEAMLDCLRAVEESCTHEISLESRIAQIIHFLYEKDVISEEAIMKWHKDLLKNQSSLCRQSGLTKLIDWLQQSSEESEEESE